ncbi:methyltransferase domain-containing protein [Caldivirga maquilingensis]|uniref:class I SAM-dependent methyltransferase n=1 Tax=Caldivirga maquilingensis TaxID=76887 RepID=UPI0026C3D7BA
MKIFYKLGVQTAGRLGLYVERTRTYLKIILRLIRVLRTLRSKCIALDLGCGDGYFAYKVSRLCMYVLGIDIKFHNSWKSKHNVNTEYIVADARYLPLRSNSIDLIYALSLLELVEPHTKLPLLGLVPKTLRRVILHHSNYSDLQFNIHLKNLIRELRKQYFNVIGIVPHYHSKHLRVIPIAPSYFIIALKEL